MPNERSHRPRPVPLVLTLALMAGGCDSSTAPDTGAPLDVGAVLADYDAVDRLLASPELNGFRALSGRTPFSGSAAGIGAVAALDAPRAGDAGAYARRLAAGLAAVSDAGAPDRAPIISEAHRGATLVYDPTLDRYVVDPARDGAPMTGVRFVLYEADDAGRPVPAEEIGYADLVDEGDGSAEDVVLHLIVHAHDRTVLDYRTSVDVGLTWAEVAVRGFLQDEHGTRLEFAIEARGTRSLSGGTLDVSFDLGIEAREFAITGSVGGLQDGGVGAGDIALSVRHGAHTLDVDATGSAGQIDAAVYLDGELFATARGDARNPTILSAGGDPLTAEERVVLHRVMDTVEDVFDFLEDLLDPVDEILLAGFIL